MLLGKSGGTSLYFIEMPLCMGECVGIGGPSQIFDVILVLFFFFFFKAEVSCNIKL